MFCQHVHFAPLERLVPEEGNGYPETVVTESCEQPCGYRELNPDLLQEQLVLLKMKPSLQSPCLNGSVCVCFFPRTVALLVTLPLVTPTQEWGWDDGV